LDAWVLRHSYSPLTTIGYEIKCSRQDFEQDQKWTGYLDLCHLFYFVCPAGLIRATDLPARVGIIWASKDALHVKRKAERVAPDTEKLNRLLIYVVMARSQIVANMYDINKAPQEDRLVSLKRLVEDATARKELAYFIKGHIRAEHERIAKVDREMAGREGNVKRFEEKLASLGIVWDSTANQWTETARVEAEIDHFRKRLDIWTLREMENMGKRLMETSQELQRFHTQS
jgi:hypothetical protein